ncbi:hypothetical protein ACROYT_G013140 [Oculina patagonica]
MIGTKAMKELSTLKRELKCWENMFERTHGRKPNKDDINSGPDEIRESYRKYRVLKDSISKTDKEGSKQAGDDEVFGKNLNKKVEDLKLSTLPFRAKEWADITPNDAKINPSGNNENEPAISIDHNFQDVKVIDTSEHKITSTNKKIGSSLLCSSHQSRNVRVKKRGAISSAWLEKYKPELPEDTDKNKLHSARLVENKSDSVNISPDEQMSTAEEKSLDRENNTLSTTGQSVVPCISENGKETSGNSIVEERNSKKKDPEINFKTNNLGSAKEEICKMVDKTKTDVTSKSKEREEKINQNKDLHLKVSNRCEAQRKSCTSDPDLFATPIVSNESEKDIELTPFEDSGDFPQEVTRNKRKADNETTGQEKPHKKFRCESDNEDEICEESKVENSADEDDDGEDLPPKTSKQEAPNRTSKAKVSSGLVSDNFQRLNMKHKSYRRRGGGISGSAHKRKAWKQIMKSRGEFVPQKSWNSKGSRGGGGGRSGACFKCGQEGHWAKNCRGPKRQGSSFGSGLKSWYVCQVACIISPPVVVCGVLL